MTGPICQRVGSTLALCVAAVLCCVCGTFAEESPRQKEVDRAIVQALEWLAETQEPSGAWTASNLGESPAITSLAVMSFLAAGHVPGEGPYALQIERGVQWILSQQQRDGMFADRGTHGPFYSHGITVLMLAEVLGMSSEADAPAIRRALEKGVALILTAQNVGKDANNDGGWRYQSSSRDSDLSVTGWQLLALRAAKNVGCDVPAENIDRAVAYVKRCAAFGGGFEYQPGSGTSPTRTGIGILSLEICGEHHSREALAGADYLLSHPLRRDQRFFYYGAYYCSLGMFQIGGRHWEETRDHLTDMLLAVRKLDGSWDAPRGGDEGLGGDVYATSLAVLSLAVEYQYLPIYQR